MLAHVRLVHTLKVWRWQLVCGVVESEFSIWHAAVHICRRTLTIYLPKTNLWYLIVKSLTIAEDFRFLDKIELLTTI